MSKLPKNPSPTASPPQTSPKRSSGAAKCFASVGLFLLTLIFSLLFLSSSILYSTVSQNRLPNAMEQVDLSQVLVAEDGRHVPLHQFLYDHYFWQTGTLTAEYVQVLLEQPETNALVGEFLETFTAYLSNESQTCPTFSTERLVGFLQNDINRHMETETGIYFTQHDRGTVTQAFQADFDRGNQVLEQVMGYGAGKMLLRFGSSLAGVITFGAATFALFLLWLTCAIRGHWRKGSMLTGYGIAALLPGAIVLLGGGIFALLFDTFGFFPLLQPLRLGLHVLLRMMLAVSVIPTAYGLLFALTGGLVRRAGRKSAAKKAQQLSLAHEMPAEAPQPEASEPEFQYATVGAPMAEENAPAAPSEPLESAAPYAAETPTAPQSTVEEVSSAAISEETSTGTETPPHAPMKYCPHCGAPSEPDSQFCGSCGEKF